MLVLFCVYFGIPTAHHILVLYISGDAAADEHVQRQATDAGPLRDDHQPMGRGQETHQTQGQKGETIDGATAASAQPLSGFESHAGHVRKLPVTWR